MKFCPHCLICKNSARGSGNGKRGGWDDIESNGVPNARGDRRCTLHRRVVHSICMEWDEIGRVS